MKSFLLPVTVLGILVFLLGLFTRGTLCRESIESKLAANTRERLAAAGYSGVHVAFDHLDARLTGTVPTEADRNQVAQIVGGTDAVRLLKRHHRVTVETIPAAPIVKPVPASLSINRSGNNTLLLSGVVPDEVFASQLVSEVRRVHPNAKINNDLANNSAAVGAWWLDGALPTVRDFLSNTSGDASLDFQLVGLNVRATVPDMATRQSLESNIASLAPAGVKPEFSFFVAKPVVKSVPMSMALRNTAQSIELHGQVPDAGTKEAILTSIKEARPTINVVDKLNINAQAVAPEWAGQLPRVTQDFLTRVPDGAMSFIEGNVQLSGEIESAEQRMQLIGNASQALGSDDRVINRLTVRAVPEPTAEEKKLVNVFRDTAVYFVSGSTSITRADHPKILQTAEAIKASSPERILYVGGYADASGNAEANRRLSLKRAETVKKVLVRAGVPENQLVVESFGEESIRPASELWKSRRVELSIKK